MIFMNWLRMQASPTSSATNANSISYSPIPLCKIFISILGDQLELVLELVGDFFWEEEGVCGGWNKWRGATRGPRGRGRA